MTGWAMAERGDCPPVCMASEWAMHSSEIVQPNPPAATASPAVADSQEARPLESRKSPFTAMRREQKRRAAEFRRQPEGQGTLARAEAELHGRQALLQRAVQTLRQSHAEIEAGR